MSNHTLLNSFRKLFDDSALLERARAMGVVQRLRRIHPVDLVQALVLSTIGEESRSIASARRTLGAISGQTPEESSFYDRFTAPFARFVQSLWVDACASLPVGEFAELRDVLETLGLADLLAVDGCQFSLPSWARELWPSTDEKRGGYKVTALFSVLRQHIENIRVTAARVHDRKAFRLPRWLHGTLLLMDKGYFDAQLFGDIMNRSGHFLCRMKKNVRPRIVAIRHGLPSERVGSNWNPEIPISDFVDIDVEFKTKKGKRVRCRVVGVMRDWDLPVGGNPITCWFATSLSAELCNAHQLATLYRLRWTIETQFHILKHLTRLDHLKTANSHVIQAFLYAALLALTFSRTLASELQKMTPDREVSLYRVTATLLLWVPRLLVVSSCHNEARLAAELEAFLQALKTEAVNPNPKRPYTKTLYSGDFEGFGCYAA